MARFTDYTDEEFEYRENTRKRILWQMQVDLVGYARSIGQTNEQIDSRLDELFGTFPGEWSLFLLTGNAGIITALQNDVTLSWLDVDVAGQTIRQRIIARLNEA